MISIHVFQPEFRMIYAVDKNLLWVMSFIKTVDMDFPANFGHLDQYCQYFWPYVKRRVIFIVVGRTVHDEILVHDTTSHPYRSMCEG